MAPLEDVDRRYSDPEVRVVLHKDSSSAHDGCHRYVRFDETVKVMGTIARVDFSEEEKSSYFYSKAEHNLMITEAKQVANTKKRLGLPFGKSGREVDKRGLETLTRARSIEVRMVMRHAVAAVLETQTQMKQDGKSVDEAAIATAYQHVTALVIKDALNRATEDRAAVQEKGSVEPAAGTKRTWRRRNKKRARQ